MTGGLEPRRERAGDDISNRTALQFQVQVGSPRHGVSSDTVTIARDCSRSNFLFAENNRSEPK
jgi:hypothetical protein